MHRISIRGATLALSLATLTTGLGVAVSSADSPAFSQSADSSPAANVRGETHGLQAALAERHRVALVAAVEKRRAEAARAAAAKRAAEKAAAERRAAAERASREAHRRALYSGDPRTIGRAMLADFGWGNDTQWQCLDALWTRESNWQIYETNPSSGAYGIPQALPGYKMASAGSDWRTNPRTQILWGLRYIAGRYGTPCGAWAHSQAYNFY